VLRSTRASPRVGIVFIAVGDSHHLTTRGHDVFWQCGMIIARTVLRLQCCSHAISRAISRDNARGYWKWVVCRNESDTRRAEEVVSLDGCALCFSQIDSWKDFVIHAFLMFRLARRKLWRARCEQPYYVSLVQRQRRISQCGQAGV
jgi:hypothetical protein